ncbi:MAG TPA: dienelactone hydrolase family protein, partial [Verrucomicrobiae bacterium]
FYAGKVEAVDLIQVLDYLQYHQLCGTNIGVLGYSFGADLALYWAARDPRVKSVVSIAAYNHPEAAVPRFAKEMHIPISEPVINQALVLVADQLGIPWSVLSAEAAVPKITAPILFIGATGDTISPPADLVALKKAAAPGCRALMVDGLKHEMIGYDFAHLAQPVRQWFEQTLTVAAP